MLNKELFVAVCGTAFLEDAEKEAHEATCAHCQDGGALLVKCLDKVRWARTKLKHGNPMTAVTDAVNILDELLEVKI